MGTPEGKLKNLVDKLCKKYEREYSPHFWFYKVSDRYTSGIPDFHILFRGTAIYLELKRLGEVPDQLQMYVMGRARKAGGLSLSADNINSVKRFLAGIAGSHTDSAKQEKPTHAP